jgi:hypothetical protein
LGEETIRNLFQSRRFHLQHASGVEGARFGGLVQDVSSGAVTRPQREALLKAARRRELDIILVWRLDR